MTGGDISAAKTHVAAARTLGAALGLPDALVAGDYVASAGGKIIAAAVATPPG